ncbi:hypothetical protein QUB60_12550 [Microcoleus sp. A2-C5]
MGLFGWSIYLNYKSIIVDRVIHRDRVIQATGFGVTAGYTRELQLSRMLAYLYCRLHP